MKYRHRKDLQIVKAIQFSILTHMIFKDKFTEEKLTVQR